MTTNEPPVWFWYLFAAGTAWVLIVFGLRTLHRRISGKPILANPPLDALFVERWRSGSSNRSLLAKLGNANNCLMVAVTREALIVRPHFPFVVFMPEFLGLELEVPRRMIHDVATVSGVFSRDTVVGYDAGDGRDVTLTLRLKDPAAFKAALGR